MPLEKSRYSVPSVVVTQAPRPVTTSRSVTWNHTSERGIASRYVVHRRDIRARHQGEAHMRVVVDFDLCESNAICMQVAPEVFEVRDDDFLYVLQEEPDESLRPKVEEAVRR